MTKKVKTVVGIPARMASTRFPGKPLRKIMDLPMIEHVYKRCALSKQVDQVFVAACDPEIQDVVTAFGGIAIMTDPDIQRPALRVAEACKQLDLDDDDIVVVVQGDEPLVHPDMIDLAVQPLIDNPDIFCVNLMGDLTEEQWKDPNEIKVVHDLNMNAIYMSRSPIPSGHHPENKTSQHNIWQRQVCIFPFRKKSLLAFNNLSETPLEIAESVEMMRAIEHGYKVRLVYSPFSTKSVDTDHDREEVEKVMKEDKLCSFYIHSSDQSV